MAEKAPPSAIPVPAPTESGLRHRLIVTCLASDSVFLTEKDFTPAEVRSLGPLPCPHCKGEHRLICLKKATTDGFATGVRPEFAVLIGIENDSTPPDDMLPAIEENVGKPFSSLFPGGAPAWMTLSKAPGGPDAQGRAPHRAFQRRRKRR